MRLFSLHVLLSGLLAAAVLVPVAGQDAPKKAPDTKRAETGPDYREFFKKPTNAAEFWRAIQFEIEVGRFDLAAGHLHGLLQYKPTDAELVKLADQVGIAAFLRLRNILTWVDDPKANKRVLNDVETLIARVTEAVKRVRGDPKRIAMYIQNLTASPEENAYALKELYRAGAVVVPPLIEAIRAAQPEDRVTLLEALRQLGPETLPPILAALDSNDARLQGELIDLLRKRAATDAVPSLWFLSASASRPDEVRQKATAALSFLLQRPIGELPSAKLALTQEAERYYRHQVKFPNSAAVSIWRWDGQHLVEGWPGAPTIPASRAEEYYGLKYAGQALTLDPAYGPAQVIWLSLSLDKAQEAAGLSEPLDRTAPAVHAMLASVSPDLVNAVLERALKEHRVGVILAAVRDLGARDEVRAHRPSSRTAPPLVGALHYPDRRVQFAAAEAMLRIPGSAAAQATTRVVEILRRALAADPGAPSAAVRPKVLLGYFDEDQRTRVALAVAAAGFEPIKASTGREVLGHLGQASDIDLVLIDEALPDPGLASLLAQLRADVHVGLLPIILTATPEREDPVRRFAEPLANVTVVPALVLSDPHPLQALLQARIGEPGNPPLSAAERKDYAERAVVWLNRLAKGEVAGYAVRPAAATVLNALRTPSRLRPEGQIAAAEIAGRLPGRESQRVLAEMALDGKRPVAVRVAAAAQLIRHIQSFSPLLPRSYVAQLMGLASQPDLDPPLKAQLALVLGSLQPDARLTGERLLQYQPPPPSPPAPAKKE